MIVFALALTARVYGPSKRRRVLPVYVDPQQPNSPAPIPGDPTRKLRYSFESPAQLAFVRDVSRYGAFVHAVSEDVGVVVDVAFASVADDGSAGAIVGRCVDPDARCLVSKVVKEFPYAAAAVSPLLDEEEDDDDDPLAAYDLLEDEVSIATARERCARALDEALVLAEALDPNLGSVDEAGLQRAAGEYRAMRDRLQLALDACESSDDPERADRTLGFQLLALAGASGDLVARCVATRSPLRRYAAIARFVDPLRAELSALSSLKTDLFVTSPPRPAPPNVPIAVALLRPGRRISYWWSEMDKWAAATVEGLDPNNHDYIITFDDAYPKQQLMSREDQTKAFPLAGADRWRWRLLPL